MHRLLEWGRTMPTTKLVCQNDDGCAERGEALFGMESWRAFEIYSIHHLGKNIVVCLKESICAW